MESRQNDDIIAWLERVEAKLNEDGFDRVLRQLADQAYLLPRMLDHILNKEIGLFHNLAGKLPVIDLRDYGAILLERAAATSESPMRKACLYREASYRAGWACHNERFGTKVSPDYARIFAKAEASAFDVGAKHV